MIKKDMRSENDNLKLWRAKKATLTEQLLKKSLEELVKLKAVINQKTVCEIMDKLANQEDREYKAVITPSAISKNEVYKNMILEAKEQVQLSNDHKKSYKLDGDKKLEIFQLKTIIAKKEVKIKELESIINRANIQVDEHNFTTYSNSNSFDFKSITNDLKNFILDQGVGFIDTSNNLVDEDTHNILIAANIMESLNA
ncbi:hypothetical protein ACOL3L_10565 [Aliarcobacter butzleri]|jgi:hypothetical protein